MRLEILFSCHRERELIGCKWVYMKIPIITEKEEETFEAHLVAKWYPRQKGIDFDEIFSLIVRHTSIRAQSGCQHGYTFIADGCENNFPPWQSR